jgi:hypothetical protein
VTRTGPDVRVGVVGAGGTGGIHSENRIATDGARVLVDTDLDVLARRGLIVR